MTHTLTSQSCTLVHFLLLQVYTNTHPHTPAMLVNAVQLEPDHFALTNTYAGLCCYTDEDIQLIAVMPEAESTHPLKK